MRQLLLLALVFYCLNGFASLNLEGESPENAGSKMNPLLNYQVYAAKRAGSIEVLGAVDDNLEEMPEWRGRLLEIPESSVLEMVDTSADGEEVTLTLDLEAMMAEGLDVEGLPNIFRVRARDLTPLRLALIELDGFESEDFPLPAMVAGPGGKAGMTYCLRDVRTFASNRCGAKIVRTEKAADAMALYLSTGDWEKIRRSSWDKYPVCTACFYGGGRQDCSKGRNGTACGHAAIKVSEGRWKGAGTRREPGLPDKNGVFKGVRRKPYQFQGCIVPKRLNS